MQYDEVYNGYRILYQRGNSHALIWQPGSNTAMTVFPEATSEEGLSVLRERTHAAIDKDILENRSPAA